jgi:hypothetical protein
MASAKGFDYMFCPPNSTTVSWRIVEIQKAETSGVATLKLPAATTLLAGVCNAAVAVVSIQLGINRIYIETDY